MKYLNLTLIGVLTLIIMQYEPVNYDELIYSYESKLTFYEDQVDKLSSELVVLNSRFETMETSFNIDTGDSNLLGTFEATAYSDNVESQGKWVGQTATGRKPAVGVIAVDPAVIPLETELYVEGYGYCVAGDVGGAIKGDRLDLFMDTRDECRVWGRQDVRVWRVD